MDGKPTLFLGFRLWVFFQKWICATCMYIVFIKTIYVVFQEEQRTIQCRLCLVNLLLRLLLVEKPGVNKAVLVIQWASSPSLLETQHFI